MNIKKKYHLTEIHNILKGLIFIADSAKYDVLKNRFLIKRHTNSYQIFLIFYHKKLFDINL